MDYLEFRSMMESQGITDRDFINGLSGQLINADSVSGDGLEFAASVIKGVKPKDQLEVMLAAQMAIMHMSTMKFLRQLGVSAETEQSHIERTVTKLAGTYTKQMLALKRYRTGGEHKVTVQHVSVADGGRAIVGPVTQNAIEQPVDKPAALTDERQSAEPMDEAQAWRDYEARHPEIAQARHLKKAAAHDLARGRKFRR